jgi:hypothetical protein
MADSLFDILARKDYDEPPEIAAIKKYISDMFDESVEVICRERDITITATSAALASTLRYHVRHLQKAADTKKRIIFRIR